MGGPVGRWGQSEGPAEAGREGSDAPQAHVEADVRDRPVGVAQQRGCSFEATRQQVLVRRIAEGPTELATEVSGGEVRDVCECGDVERLAVAGVDEVLRAKEVADGVNGRHRWRSARMRRAERVQSRPDHRDQLQHELLVSFVEICTA